MCAVFINKKVRNFIGNDVNNILMYEIGLYVISEFDNVKKLHRPRWQLTLIRNKARCFWQMYLMKLNILKLYTMCVVFFIKIKIISVLGNY